MLSKLRSFSKGKLATVLVAIIIIPFVFWGMGSVFSGGNTNSLAKINSFNISTKDFVNHINNSQLSSEIIKENINNNVLEDLLRELVANSMIDIEIKRTMHNPYVCFFLFSSFIRYTTPPKTGISTMNGMIGMIDALDSVPKLNKTLGLL